MAAPIEIGDSSDHSVSISDELITDGDAVYEWYLKPEEIQMTYSTPELIKDFGSFGMNLCSQYGSQIAFFTMKNIIISPLGADDAFDQFEKLKKALWNWTCNNKFLYFAAKDVNGHEWSKMLSFENQTTFATMQSKLITPMLIVTLPNGDYLIKQLKVIQFTGVIPL